MRFGGLGGNMENNLDEDIKNLEKYISFSKKDENFSNITDYVWHKELGEMIERALSELETYKKIAERLAEEVILHIAFAKPTDENIKTLIENARNEVEKDGN
jgi:hypothetical protein